VIKKKVTKILVPLDGSENSMRGLEMAISVARSFGATITGIFSINLPPHTEFRGVGSVRESLHKEAKEFLEKAKVLAAQNGIVFTEKIMQGDPGYNIIKFAHNKRDKFDLVVIGSRGRGSIKEMFFGSVSNYVIHSSKIPVLIVK